jgi:hypothetical protein
MSVIECRSEKGRLLNWLKRVFGSKSSPESRDLEDRARGQLEYFEVDRPDGDGRCSDNDCPCPSPGTRLSRGRGYLIISEACVEFRRDARTLEESRIKAERIQGQGIHFVARGVGVVTPVLCCDQSPRLRVLNKEVAADDAAYWWKTGRAPLRPTPLA